MTHRGLEPGAAAAWAMGRALYAAARGRRRVAVVRFTVDVEAYMRALRAIAELERRAAAHLARPQ